MTLHGGFRQKKTRPLEQTNELLDKTRTTSSIESLRHSNLNDVRNASHVLHMYTSECATSVQTNTDNKSAFKTWVNFLLGSHILGTFNHYVLQMMPLTNLSIKS